MRQWLVGYYRRKLEASCTIEGGGDKPVKRFLENLDARIVLFEDGYSEEVRESDMQLGNFDILHVHEAGYNEARGISWTTVGDMQLLVDYEPHPSLFWPKYRYSSIVGMGMFALFAL
ncbi:MAG: hypothetical protein ACP5MH_11340 [Thermoproteus sp.]